MIDWTVARRTAATLTRPGPDLTPEQTHEVVATLREAAELAEGPVRDYTGLVAPPTPESEAPVLVVDRTPWVEANLSTFSTILEPVFTRSRRRDGRRHRPARSVASSAASRSAP